MLLKVRIEERDYKRWDWFDGFTLELSDCEINPLNNKLFSDDIIDIKEGVLTIVHSIVRCMKYIPGVLLITGNTYGRYKDKLLYKCVPDDKRLPIFLVPYELKKGFNKVSQDLYVTFRFTEWINKHPLGCLTNNLGKVSELCNFYEYQLYCKSLNATMQVFTKNTLDVLKEKTDDEFIASIMLNNPKIIDRTEYKIFSIDSAKTLDIDDALSVSEDMKTGIIKLSIYIANVGIWLDSLNLWSSFSERISTIYLPDKKRPMLPTILSDCLCSLLENRKRFAYVLDVYIKDNNIIKCDVLCSLICVYKNYKYEDDMLLNDDNYKNIFNIVLNLSKNIKLLSSIKDSHDIVSYLMVLMNSKCADILMSYKDGIYRYVNVSINERVIPSSIPDDISKFLRLWNNFAGQYSVYSNMHGHILIGDGMDNYVHITSPIRRLVDLLNSIRLQQLLCIYNFSNKASEFYDKWLKRLDYINTTMRVIRKVQNDCAILDMVSKDALILDNTYDGYLFDKIERNDGLLQYTVYLHKLKLLSRVTLRINVDNYSMARFKIYIFNDAYSFKRKVRLHLE